MNHLNINGFSTIFIFTHNLKIDFYAHFSKVNMPVVWIHRYNACDILVQFSETRKQDAIKFAHTFLYETDDDCTIENEISNNWIIHLGFSSSVQIFLTLFDIFHPNDYFNMSANQGTWNPRGFAQVAEDEARDLGVTGEPEGFVPYSNQIIWKNNYKSQAELDAELDAYYGRETTEMIIDG